MKAWVIKTENTEQDYSLQDWVKVGDIYEVNPETLHYLPMLNMESGEMRKVLCVWAEPKAGSHSGFLPADLLDWMGKEKHLQTLEGRY